MTIDELKNTFLLKQPGEQTKILVSYCNCRSQPLLFHPFDLVQCQEIHAYLNKTRISYTTCVAFSEFNHASYLV